MNGDDDQVLSALDQLTNALYWYRPRDPVTAADAIVDAVDDWIAEHNAEHHQSKPFTEPSTARNDRLAAVLASLHAAVDKLADSGTRPDLTMAVALGEALGDWAAVAAAEHHSSEPFQR
jgi:hypothetical protein